jgi:hypothetical protein
VRSNATSEAYLMWNLARAVAVEVEKEAEVATQPVHFHSKSKIEVVRKSYSGYLP